MALWDTSEKAVLDWVFPLRCGMCGRLGDDAICDLCFSDFEPFIEGDSPGHITYCDSLFSYRGRAAQAVRRLKYERATSLVRPMARLLHEFAVASAVSECDLVVPVPIHWRRRVVRGFNQSELLCEAFDFAPVEPGLLERIRPTLPQARLSPQDRRSNLIGAFRASQAVQGKVVTLVDDVTTSGHTAEQCALALMEAGAKEVRLLTFCAG